MRLISFPEKKPATRFNRILLILLTLFIIAPCLAIADWINLTGAETSPNIAEIYVQDDHIELVLEIYIGELNTFEDLVPDVWIKDSKLQRASLEKRLLHFANDTFQFVTEKGKKLPASLTLVEPRMRIDRQSPFAGMINPYTRQRVPGAPADKRVLYAEITYPFHEKPEELTIIPPLDEGGRNRATIGFIAYHKAVPIIDFRYLSSPAHLTLNWDDPWYSKFDNSNLKRHHKDALMSFLYVEPYEVRHEILIRVRDMEAWIDLDLEGRQFIEIDELEPVKKQIGEFLLDRNPVRIDGQALLPVLDRVNFVTVGLKGIRILEKPQRLEVSTAIVGVIISYITEGMPQQVMVEWDLFNDRISKVPTTATDPAGPLPSFVTPEDPVLIWTNYLKNFKLPTVAEINVSEALTRKHLPLVSTLSLLVLLPIFWMFRNRHKTRRSITLPVASAIALLLLAAVSYPYLRIAVPVPSAMAADLNDQQQKQLLQALLKNVYRAFDFRNEEDVYDKLAISVSGNLLTDIYLQNRKSFAIKKAGGAQAKVKNVEILNIEAQRLDEIFTYSFKARWTASGTVGHWGHIHTRKNLYDAIITVKAVDGNWKITGLELLEEKRIDPGVKDFSAKQPVAG